MKSLVILCRAFAIRVIFLSPSGVSSSSNNSFFARALAVLLLSLPPCLPVCSYLCLPDVSHIFIASFLAFVTFCTVSFHHHVSLSHGDLHPAVKINTSCPTLKIVILLHPFLHTLHWSFFLQHRLPKFYFRIIFL